jgi:hypothetical protein
MSFIQLIKTKINIKFDINPTTIECWIEISVLEINDRTTNELDLARLLKVNRLGSMHQKTDLHL